MRQHVLVPADRLAAACVMRSQTLILYAEGQAPNYTYDITFNRKAWEGGLRFELQGWWLPARGTLPYKAHKAFHIADIHAADPGGRALVVTANHPGGVLVPILGKFGMVLAMFTTRLALHLISSSNVNT
jgi:hypothetical protein